MDAIEKAFQSTERANFIPEQLRADANLDAPLPIGFGQTISQPSTVALMLNWLETESGDVVLDVGSGSGWTSALLSKLVGSSGRIYAVERIPELVEFGRDNCERAGIKNVRFYNARKGYGLPGHAPYDRILVSAGADEVPTDLLNQLKKGGKMVIPIKNDILEITKKSENDYEIDVHPGFIFVPLIKG